MCDAVQALQAFDYYNDAAFTTLLPQFILNGFPSSLWQHIRRHYNDVMGVSVHIFRELGPRL